MQKLILVTRPENDDVTKYLSNVAKNYIEFAKTKGFAVIDLHVEKANKEEFQKQNKRKPNLIVLNGHGDYTYVNGHMELPILSIESAKELKSRIIYSISCSSAKELGKKSVEEGAIAYIGYDEPFFFIFDENSTTRTSQDLEAGIFFEHTGILIKSLIKGNSINESYLKAVRNLEENYEKALVTEGTDSDAASFLAWDLKYFKMYSDNNQATIC